MALQHWTSIDDFFPLTETLHEYVLSEKRDYKSCLPKYRLSWRKMKNADTEQEQWYLLTMNSSLLCAFRCVKRVGDTTLFLDDGNGTDITEYNHWMQIDTSIGDIAVTYRHRYSGGSGDDNKWIEEILHVCCPAHSFYGGIAEVLTFAKSMIWSSSNEDKIKLD